MLRAVAARAVCAAGLHPSLGLHHHNRYDAFCLADDVMEPFRPLVDEAVFALAGELGKDAELAPEVKRRLIGALLEPVELDGEKRSIFDAMARLCASSASPTASLAKWSSTLGKTAKAPSPNPSNSSFFNASEWVKPLQIQGSEGVSSVTERRLSVNHSYVPRALQPA